jgi:hypothetical protein
MKFAFSVDTQLEEVITAGWKLENLIDISTIEITPVGEELIFLPKLYLQGTIAGTYKTGGKRSLNT